MANRTVAWQWLVFVNWGGRLWEPRVVFFATLGQKSGTVLGPDSGPEMGTAIHRSVIITIGGRKTDPILGPESGTRNGSAF